MEQKHYHHVHGRQLTSLNTVFIVSIVLNILYVIIEASIGFWKDSLGLLSDAGHNLGDVFSLLLALIAIRLTAIPPSRNHTYGYKKSTVLISLANALILIVAVGFIVMESVHKFNDPTPIDGVAISWTAGLGILVNGITAWMLMRQQKGDINIRGAFLHMAADTLVSLGVVVSGVIISVTGYSMIDPIISLVISGIILFSTWHLLKESLNLSLDGVPSSISIEEIKGEISKLPHVKEVHHVHIWAISTTENALTAHVVLDDIGYMQEVKNNIRKLLLEKNISHCTIETETAGTECLYKKCD